MYDGLMPVGWNSSSSAVIAQRERLLQAAMDAGAARTAQTSPASAAAALTEEKASSADKAYNTGALIEYPLLTAASLEAGGAVRKPASAIADTTTTTTTTAAAADLTEDSEEGYREGFMDGYKEGRKEGYQGTHRYKEAYRDGFREGRAGGYIDGKQEGYRGGRIDGALATSLDEEWDIDQYGNMLGSAEVANGWRGQALTRVPPLPLPRQRKKNTTVDVVVPAAAAAAAAAPAVLYKLLRRPELHTTAAVLGREVPLANVGGASDGGVVSYETTKPRHPQQITTTFRPQPSHAAPLERAYGSNDDAAAAAASNHLEFANEPQSGKGIREVSSNHPRRHHLHRHFHEHNHHHHHHHSRSSGSSNINGANNDDDGVRNGAYSSAYHALRGGHVDSDRTSRESEDSNESKSSSDSSSPSGGQDSEEKKDTSSDDSPTPPQGQGSKKRKREMQDDNDDDDDDQGQSSPEAATTTKKRRSRSSKKATCLTDSSESDKKRKRATREQLDLLERVFEQEELPSRTRRKELANELGFSPRRIQIWFQNRRAKSKKKEGKQYVMVNYGKHSFKKEPRESSKQGGHAGAATVVLDDADE